MEEDHKFFVTPNRIMDADTVVDAEYVPDGSGGGKAEFRLCFKTGEAMTLSGEAADAAWESFHLDYAHNQASSSGCSALLMLAVAE